MARAVDDANNGSGRFGSYDFGWNRWRSSSMAHAARCGLVLFSVLAGFSRVTSAQDGPEIQRLKLHIQVPAGPVQFSLPNSVNFTIPNADIARIGNAKIRARVFRGTLDSLRSNRQAFDVDSCTRLISTVFPAYSRGSQLELLLNLFTLTVSSQRKYYESERFVIVWERADAGDPYPSMTQEVMRMHRGSLQEYFRDAIEIELIPPSQTSDTVRAYTDTLAFVRQAAPRTQGDGSSSMVQRICVRRVMQQQDDVDEESFGSCNAREKDLSPTDVEALLSMLRSVFLTP
jgi:hypothetical protein